MGRKTVLGLMIALFVLLGAMGAMHSVKEIYEQEIPVGLLPDDCEFIVSEIGGEEAVIMTGERHGEKLKGKLLVPSSQVSFYYDKEMIMHIGDLISSKSQILGKLADMKFAEKVTDKYISTTQINELSDQISFVEGLDCYNELLMVMAASAEDLSFKRMRLEEDVNTDNITAYQIKGIEAEMTWYMVPSREEGGNNIQLIAVTGDKELYNYKLVYSETENKDIEIPEVVSKYTMGAIKKVMRYIKTKLT